MIIGIIGEKLAGKDVVAEYLQKRHSAFYVKYSQIIDEILNILDIPISRRNEIDLGHALRGQFKTNVFWAGMKKRILESTAHIKVIGSIRLPDEVNDAKTFGAKILYITAPIETRHDRLMNSRREKGEDGNQSFDDFVKQEQEWTEIQIPQLGTEADFKIENSGSLEELYKKIDEVISQLK